MMYLKSLTSIFIIISALVVLPLKTAFAEEADPKDNWEITVEPYLLFTSIVGDAKMGRTSSVDMDVNFNDILEVLDVGYKALWVD